MNGTTPTLFSPTLNVSRASMVCILYRLAGSPTVSFSNVFTDVSSTAYYALPVSWAYQNNIAGGVTPTTFAPDDPIKREEVALLYYRYASLMNYDIAGRLAITDLNDYNQISDYARDAVSWIMYHGVMNGTSPTTFSPKGYMNREHQAAAVTRFGIHISKFNLNTDAYGFSNSSTYFPNSNSNGKYYMTESDFALLRSTVIRLGGTEADIAKISSYANHAWVGSCYGMAITAMLDKLGKIDLNGNFSASSTMRGITQNNSRLESVINYYQCLQYAPLIPTGKERLPEGQSTMSLSAFRQLCGNTLRKNDLVFFPYFFIKNGQMFGHAILLYDYYIENNCFVAKAYDNRYPNDVVLVRLASNNQTLTVELPGNQAESIIDFGLITSIETFDCYDIDGYSNELAYDPVTNALENSTTGTSIGVANGIEGSFNSTVQEYTRLLVGAYGNFTITNAEGETLTFTDGVFSGTMPLVDYSFVVSGDNSPCEIILYVETSEKYTYTANNSNSSFYLLHNDHYIGLGGSGVSSIEIENETKVRVNGALVIFSSEIFLPEENRTITLSGEARGDISFTRQINEVSMQSSNVSNCCVQVNGEDVTSQNDMLQSDNAVCIFNSN